MQHATPAQVKMLQYLRRQHGMDEDAYRAMLHNATSGRTSSTKELTQEEAFGLIDGLVKTGPSPFALRPSTGSGQQAQGSKLPSTSSGQQQQQAVHRMRRKIIGMAREMGWIKQVPVYSQVGDAVGFDLKADLERINQWCCKYGFGHKPLNRYAYAELSKLLTQFEQGPYKHYLKSI